jgi:hypothetical protein
MCQRTRVRIEYHFYKNQNTNVSDRAAGSGVGGASGVDDIVPRPHAVPDAPTALASVIQRLVDE